MNWLNIDEDLLKDVGADEVQSGSGVLASGVYDVKIENAFLRQTDSGAVMFELSCKDKEDRSIFWSTCVKSGDAKGNKATYIDKNNKEQLLPGIISVKHLFEACGLDMTTSAPTAGKIEFKNNIIDAKIFKDLTGKKFKACVRQYENEYNNEISIKYDIENFADSKGNNSNGDNIVDKFLEKIEKSPIKLLKKKANTQQANQEAVVASGW